MSVTFTNKGLALSSLTCSRLNVRKHARGRGVEDLATSIASHGLIQPLTVVKSEDRFEVVAGGRRLAAIRLLAERGTWAGNVPCRVAPEGFEPSDARLVSHAENEDRLPVHALDRLRVFADLKAKDKLTVPQIAKRFGITSQRVKETLALANLAMPIRKAFAAGNLAEEGAEAFASDASVTRQMAVWKSMHEWDRRHPSGPAIRRKLRALRDPGGKRMIASDRLARFVGIEAYKAAGGAVQCDLFTPESEGRVDGDLVRDLATKALDAVADDIRADDPNATVNVYLETDDLPETEDDRYWLEDLPDAVQSQVSAIWDVEPGHYGDCKAIVSGPFADRATVDALPDVAEADDQDEDQGDGTGATVADQGGEADADGEDETRPLSQPQLTRLAQVAERALCDAVAGDFAVAFDLALAALCQSAWGQYGRSEATTVRADVYQTGTDAGEWSDVFEAGRASANWFETVRTLDQARKERLFARLVGESVKPWAHDHMHKVQPAPMPAAVSLAEAVNLDPGAAWDNELRRIHFEGCTKADLVAGPIQAERPDAKPDSFAASTKADLVEAAVEASQTAHWLPEYLRVLDHAAPVEDVPLPIAAE